MRFTVLTFTLAFGGGICSAVNATGLATCDSGDQKTWQSQEKLTKMLTDKGWQVRRIKVDGGCYEAYVITEKGERLEAYFHPQTLASVPTNQKR